MRLVLMGFIVFFCRRMSYELKKTVNQYDEAKKARDQEAQGQAAS